MRYSIKMEPRPHQVPLPTEPVVSTVQIVPIPNEMLRLIPLFGGDKRQLSLFLRKCEYVITRFRGHEEQNIYVLHAITSRLIDNAAALLSEREDVSNWSALRELLQQHFGDPRSEECISIELESCKIKSGESYLDFCCRVQTIRSLLISKVNLLSDTELKRAKIAIYNNTALNVFLYNLPENMVRVVRLKAPATLEDALGVVLEEVNFLEQYTMRNRMHGNNSALKPSTVPGLGFKFGNTPPVTFQPQGGLKPFVLPYNYATPQKFNFGLPQNSQNIRPQFGQQNNFGYKPQLGYRPPQFGYRPQLTSQQQFGYRPQQFGYKPPQLGYKPPQFGNRPQQNFGMTPQQFGYKPPQIQKPHYQSTDVSMRTLPPRPQPQQAPQQGFRLNELTSDNDDVQYHDDYYHDGDYGYDSHDVYPIDDVQWMPSQDYNDEMTITDERDIPETETANFQIQASHDNGKS